MLIIFNKEIKIEVICYFYSNFSVFDNISNNSIEAG